MPRSSPCSPALRRVVSFLVGLTALALLRAVVDQDSPLGWSAVRAGDPRPASLSVAVDADGDGLVDAEELALAERYAPLVTLHAEDRARPASVLWLLARAGSRLGRYSELVRRGSERAAEWVTYVHVFPSVRDGGVLLQYWFFYPYNLGPLFFGHEADWEHVTVQLDHARRPLGVWASQHNNNSPGRFRPWSRLRKLGGSHPEILAARGTHASYFDLDEVPWYDAVGRCAELAGGQCRHPRWRTWEGGGLQPLGERQAPREPIVMTYSGAWGLRSVWPGANAPVGPPFQRGWCAGGTPGCPMYGSI